MNWLGLDIGGANLKAATSNGKVFSTPFRFWIEHEQLKTTLTKILKRFPDHVVAATMTAELADCFESRQQGVCHIVESLFEVCHELGIPEPLFAGTDLQFRMANEAKQSWLKTAASNWAMLARYASRYLPEQTGVVIDMGSTTTDIIPIRDGEIAAKGQTDSERLRNGELVYVGADRTPACSVIGTLEHNGLEYPVARELFATVGDAMIVRGLVDENRYDVDTADGRPKTIAHSAQRICRLVCEDTSTVGIGAAQSFADQILAQVDQIQQNALSQLQNETKIENVIVTGSGSRYAKRRLDSFLPSANITTLGSHVTVAIDSVAPAFSVAVIASERHTT